MDEWINQISGVFDETKETKRMSRLKTPEDASFGYVAPTSNSPRAPSFDRWYNTANQFNFARWKQLVDMVMEEDDNGCR